MVLICSKITYCEVLFILTLGLFTRHVSLQFKFLVKDVGTSYNFTCPDPGATKNHTYTFFAGSKTITPGGRFKQYGNILEITNLQLTDTSQYACSIYDVNGKIIGKKKVVGILSVKPGSLG